MINRQLRDEHPKALFLDNQSYDNSIIGFTPDGRAIYEYNRMIEELVAEQGWTEDEAVEWIDYNTIRAIDYTSDSMKPIVVQQLTGGDYGT